MLLMMVAVLIFSAFQEKAIAETKEIKTLYIRPIDDTYVDKSMSNTVFGANPKLVCGDTWGKFSFLKFDLSSIPKGAKIISVELQLFCYDKSASAGGILIGEEPLLEERGWSETTLTYSLLEQIAESAGAHIGGFISGFMELDLSKIEEWRSFSFNLTSYLCYYLEEKVGKNENQITFHLNLLGANGELTICSKEFAAENCRPTLIISYEKIPVTLFLQPIETDVTEGMEVRIWGTTHVEASYEYLKQWLTATYLENATITLEYEVSNASGHKISFERIVITDITGKFEDRFVPTIIGEYSVKAVFRGTDTFSSSTSGEIKFKVMENVDWQSKYIETRNLLYVFIVVAVAFIITTIFLLVKMFRFPLRQKT
jgi:hypothetical protein